MDKVLKLENGQYDLIETVSYPNGGASYFYVRDQQAIIIDDGICNYKKDEKPFSYSLITDKQNTYMNKYAKVYRFLKEDMGIINEVITLSCKKEEIPINNMVIAGYFEDDASDELTNDPVFIAVLNKDALASQPTISRFHNLMDEDSLNQFLSISRVLRKKIYSIQMPEAVILDLDSTLLDAYDSQEGRAFNFHYQSNGYHPLVCYDGTTGDLIIIQLRGGTQYSCTGVIDFLQPILDEYLADYPSINLLLRGDSGFATPELCQAMRRKWNQLCHQTKRKQQSP